MQFALLCDDLLAGPIVDALAIHLDGHQLSHAVQFPAENPLLNRRYGLHQVDHWEDLLGDTGIDAVIVGGDDPLILEGAKQLATAGIPTLFVPQAAQGSTLIYELSLIHDDNHVLLYPLLWHRFDSAVLHLKQAIRDGQLGQIQFLQLRRSLNAPPNTPIAQPDVDRELLPDTDLMRWLIGDYDQVTALRTAATHDGVLMQSVVLAGRSLPQSNWSIEPAVGPSQWKLTVRGEKGTAELVRDDASHRWICDVGGQRVEGNERATAQGVLSSFTHAVTDMARSTTEEQTTGTGWADLVKCFETVDATQRSVTRRRTIELHFEPMSERAIFKTQMTAIGCGLLILTPLLMLCYLGIANTVPLPEKVLIVLRTIVFAPLVIFLVAQVMLPFTRPSANERGPLSASPPTRQDD